MFEILHELMHAIEHSLVDSVSVIPFLFIVYALIAYVEGNQNSRFIKKLTSAGVKGPIIGSLMGCIPQCGFSVMASNLYSKKLISMATLISIFVSTSDEAILILMAQDINILGTIVMILALKVIIALIAGVTIQLVMGRVEKKILHTPDGTNIAVSEVAAGGCGCCTCGHAHEAHGVAGFKKVVWHALKHTVSIFIYILVVNVIMHIIIEGVGEDTLQSILLTNSVFQPFLASLIGLIPNCASSVILTEMYLAGTLSLGSLIAGLTSAAGVGLIVLFKANKNIVDNLKIVGILYIIGVVAGMIIGLL